MAADIVVDGEVKTLNLCGLCAHRIQLSDQWRTGGYLSSSGKTYYTQDLNMPFPGDASAVVFTSITKRGQRVMEWAQRESRNFNKEDIASTAVLMSLLTDERGASFDILRDMGVDLDKAFIALHDALKSEDGGSKKVDILDTRTLLSMAQKQATKFDDKVVEPEHIMLDRKSVV